MVQSTTVRGLFLWAIIEKYTLKDKASDILLFLLFVCFFVIEGKSVMVLGDMSPCQKIIVPSCLNGN